MVLAGPLQSWGADSRFTERKTRREPTKSGVIGLVAAAMGIQREDDIGCFSDVRMGVRIDCAGALERDFQTAARRSWDTETQTWTRMVHKKGIMPPSHRFYLTDAVFVVGLEGEDGLLAQAAEALHRPAFPLYLGRRSCPPARPVFHALETNKSLMECLVEVPWQAPRRICERHEKTIPLEIVRDVLPGDDLYVRRERVPDVPLSFSQEHREYGWREIVRESVAVRNPAGHDKNEEGDMFWDALEGGVV